MRSIGALRTFVLGVFFPLSLLAPAAYADIVNGAPAIDAIGQYDQTNLTDPVPDFDKNSENDGPNIYGLRTPQGIAIDTANHRLFVSDSNGGRVLVFNLNDSNRLVDYLPDNVLGQADFRSLTREVNASTTERPEGLAFDAERNLLFVADSLKRRVLVFDVSTITNGEAAIAVLGQSSFSSQVVGPTSALLLSSPRGVAYDSVRRRLFVGDTTFRRITVFDVNQITNGEAAVNVLGKPDFTTTTGTSGQAILSNPQQLAFDAPNNRLFVADTLNNRVMVFDVASIVNGENAVNVLCQSSFTTFNAGVSANSCNTPVGVWYDAPRQTLFVSDRNNHRIQVFSIGTTFSNGPSPSATLGQTTVGAAGLIGTSRSAFVFPASLAVNPFDGRLYMSEEGSSRVMIFDAATPTTGEEAEDLIGQYDETSYAPPVPLFTKTGPGNSPNRFGFNDPGQIVFDTARHRLFIADSGNARVLVHQLDSSDRLIDYLPDAVLGQPNFASLSTLPSQTRLSFPEGLAYDAVRDRLFVGDSVSNRILVFDTADITSGEAAVNVLGQTTFTSNGAGTTAGTLASPRRLALDPTRDHLYVADSFNNRVLIFDVASVTNGESAVHVLGQPDFSSGSGATSATKMNTPSGIALDLSGNRLFVADSSAHRVLVFDVGSITNGEAATNVLCQTTFTGDNSDVTQSTCDNPLSLAFDGERNQLHVADTDNSRVITFDTASITNGENAVHVLGKSNFTDEDFTSSATGMTSPEGVLVDTVNDRLYVSDAAARVLVFPLTYEAAYSGTTFTEASSGGGVVDTAVTLTLKNEFFAIDSGVLTRGTHYTIGTLPAGLTEVVTVLSPSTARITFSGAASANNSSNSVTGVAFSFLDAGVRNVAASNVTGLSTSFAITFRGGERCFNGVLPTPTVKVTGRNVTVTLPGSRKASSQCEVTLKGERSSPVRRLSKRLAAGKKSTVFSSLIPGKWRFFYTVKTKALGTTQTSSKKTVTVR